MPKVPDQLAGGAPAAGDLMLELVPDGQELTFGLLEHALDLGGECVRQHPVPACGVPSKVEEPEDVQAAGANRELQEVVLKPDRTREARWQVRQQVPKPIAQALALTLGVQPGRQLLGQLRAADPAIGAEDGSNQEIEPDEAEDPRL